MRQVAIKQSTPMANLLALSVDALVRSDDKKPARLNVISHILGLIPYEVPPAEKNETAELAPRSGPWVTRRR